MSAGIHIMSPLGLLQNVLSGLLLLVWPPEVCLFNVYVTLLVDLARLARRTQPRENAHIPLGLVGEERLDAYRIPEEVVPITENGIERSFVRRLGSICSRVE